MKLPIQTPPISLGAGSAVTSNGVTLSSFCTTACSLLKAGCEKIPFIPGGVCNAIYNCCIGVCND